MTDENDTRDPSERAEADVISFEERLRRKRAPLAANEEPMRLAEAFRRHCFEADGIPTLVRWARAWWRYDGTRFIEHDDESLGRDIIRFLDEVVVEKRDKQGGVHRDRVTAKSKTVNEIRLALTAVMPMIDMAPIWTSSLEGDVEPMRLLACKNGMLDLKTRRLLPATPRFFSPISIGSDWVPDAETPSTWLAFLDSVWGEDRESIQTLQQVFGYLLTPDTSQQKLFALVGPKRSGKGTIGRILTALLGAGSVVSPTLASLEKQFGMQPLVGKSVAIIGDARLGGRADQQAVVERLLSISGEDPILVDRKNRDAINVRFRVRVLLLTNELPRLYDASGAVASRFVILQTTKSFLGEEDFDLERKLVAEMPGIFRWALEGLDDLCEQGRFTVPLASQQAIEDLEALSSPITVFLAEVCTIDPVREVERQELWDRWKKWCDSNGRDPGNAQHFGRDLHTAIPTLKTVQRTRGDGKRFRYYQGVSIADL